MTGWPGALVAAALIALPSRDARQAGPPPGELVLRNVTVLDATGAPPRPGMVVVVGGGRIRAIVPLQGFHPPRGAQVVEGGGRTLIPGLWDMHVHTSSIPVNPGAQGPGRYQDNARYYLPLFIAFGVTGIRDMSGRLELLSAWRDSIRNGSLLGPRMLITGFKLGAAEPALPGAPFPLRTEAEVRQTVRLLREHGADYVKVAGLPARLVPALADECRRQGLTFVGHLPADLTIEAASLAGQRSIEHLEGVPYALSDRGAQLWRQERRPDVWWMRWLARLHLVNPERSRLEVRRSLLVSRPALADSLYALLIRQQTWQVPTLTELQDLYRVNEPEPFSEERSAYLLPYRGPPEQVIWDKDPELARRTFAHRLGIVGGMHRAGVPLLAGTDTPGRNRVPGFSLAEELTLLTRAGLSPMAALQSATREPARFLGTTDSLGTIEAGKLADLVLLDGDPLQDIRNVHRVHAVILRGRYVSPEQLDSLRSAVRARVASWGKAAAPAPPERPK